MRRACAITFTVCLAASCLLPAFDPNEKTCSPADQCPVGWRCSPAGKCTSAAAADGGQWQPTPGLSWQLQLSGTLDRSVDASVFAVNLFDVPQGDVDALKSAGRRVICQLSAGIAENGRADVGQLSSAVLGNTSSGRAGRWLDTRAPAVRGWVAARFDTAKQKGCDAVEPTDVDSFQATTGFPLNEANAVDYVRTLAVEAHARGLAMAMSNSVELAAQLVDDADFASNESCLQYNECQRLAGFVQRNKAVFHFEFGTQANVASVCAARPSGFSTIVKQTSLDAWRAACP